MWQSLASNVLTLLVLGLALVAGVVAWGKREYATAGPLGTAMCVEVPSGASMRSVSGDLAEKGAVSNATIFRLGAEYTDKAQDLKAGSFLVPAKASMEEIVEIVTRGGQSTCGTEVVYRVGVTDMDVRVREIDPESGSFVETAKFPPGEEAAPEAYAGARAASDTRYRVAVAEGVTSYRVAEALREVDILEGGIDAVPEEGTLAPDSYEVTPGATRAALIERMAERQSARLAEVWEDRGDDLPISTPEEALILASIIEKETGLAEERPEVASVFVNRLERGMRLQTDPTVIYGITEGQAPLGRGLRRSELDRATPYNTYVIAGLPPTPIANPGLQSLRAAVDPAQTDYLYFVADGSGGHAFAQTLEAHNRNVAAWRAIEAERESAPATD